jgi:hypothetical protein
MTDLQARIQEQSQRLAELPSACKAWDYKVRQDTRVVLEVLKAFERELGRVRIDGAGEIIEPLSGVIAHIACAYEGFRLEQDMIFQDPAHRGATSIAYSASACTVNIDDLNASLGSFVGNYLCDDSYSSLEGGLILPSTDDDHNLSHTGTGLWILEKLVGPEPTVLLLDAGTRRKDDVCGTLFPSWNSAVAFLRTLPTRAGDVNRVDCQSVAGSHLISAHLCVLGELTQDIRLLSRTDFTQEAVKRLAAAAVA